MFLPDHPDRPRASDPSILGGGEFQTDFQTKADVLRFLLGIKKTPAGAFSHRLLVASHFGLSIWVFLYGGITSMEKK